MLQGPRWLVVGSATVDCIVQADKPAYKAGGVAVYGGLTLLRLGQAVAVCANMASNDRDVMALIREKGAQLYLGDDMHTTHFINRIEGDD